MKIEAYEQAIRTIIQGEFFEKARGIVRAHQNPLIPEELRPLCMAHVLIVDDRPVLAAAVQKMGDLSGHSSETAHSADEAAEKLGKGIFDGVISDGLGGKWIEILKEAKKHGINKERFLVHSASSEFRDEVEALGINFVLKASRDSVKELMDFYNRIGTPNTE